MHTVDLLNESLAMAEQAGFEVRREFLGESTGGACRVGGKWLLYLDQTLPVGEQLSQVVLALRQTGCATTSASLSPTLRSLLERRHG